MVGCPKCRQAARGCAACNPKRFTLRSRCSGKARHATECAAAFRTWLTSKQGLTEGTARDYTWTFKFLLQNGGSVAKGTAKMQSIMNAARTQIETFVKLPQFKFAAQVKKSTPLVKPVDRGDSSEEEEDSSDESSEEESSEERQATPKAKVPKAPKTLPKAKTRKFQRPPKQVKSLFNVPEAAASRHNAKVLGRTAKAFKVKRSCAKFNTEVCAIAPAVVESTLSPSPGQFPEARVGASSAFFVGQNVIFDGLSARTDLNGLHGTLVCIDDSSGRWAVTVGKDKETVKVKEVNLLASTAEATSARKSAAKASSATVAPVPSAMTAARIMAVLQLRNKNVKKKSHNASDVRGRLGDKPADEAGEQVDGSSKFKPLQQTAEAPDSPNANVTGSSSEAQPTFRKVKRVRSPDASSTSGSAGARQARRKAKRSTDPAVPDDVDTMAPSIEILLTEAGNEDDGNFEAPPGDSAVKSTKPVRRKAKRLTQPVISDDEATVSLAAEMVSTEIANTRAKALDTVLGPIEAPTDDINGRGVELARPTKVKRSSRKLNDNRSDASVQTGGALNDVADPLAAKLEVAETFSVQIGDEVEFRDYKGCIVSELLGEGCIRVDVPELGNYRAAPGKWKPKNEQGDLAEADDEEALSRAAEQDFCAQSLVGAGA